MTINKLIMELSGVSWKRGTEELPIRVNGKVINNIKVTLDGDDDNQWCNIEIK